MAELNSKVISRSMLGLRAAAVQEYRRLTEVGSSRRSSAVLEPRHILALARLLEQSADRAGARVEYERFMKLWANADPDLPETAEARKAISRLSPASKPSPAAVR